MGYYINPQNMGKREYLQHVAEVVSPTPEAARQALEDLRPTSAPLTIVCLVGSGPFNAAGICFSWDEFEQFANPMDTRPKTWYVLEVYHIHQFPEHANLECAL